MFFQYNKSGFILIYGMCFFRVIEGYVWYNKSRLFSLVFMAKVDFQFFSRKDIAITCKNLNSVYQVETATRFS